MRNVFECFSYHSGKSFTAAERASLVDAIPNASHNNVSKGPGDVLKCPPTHDMAVWIHAYMHTES